MYWLHTSRFFRNIFKQGMPRCAKLCPVVIYIDERSDSLFRINEAVIYQFRKDENVLKCMMYWLCAQVLKAVRYLRFIYIQTSKKGVWRVILKWWFINVKPMKTFSNLLQHTTKTAPNYVSQIPGALPVMEFQKITPVGTAHALQKVLSK